MLKYKNMARRKQSNPGRVPKMFQKTTYNRYGGRRKAYKKRGVQQKFALQKPATRQVKALANIAECKKFRGFINYPEPQRIPIQQIYLSTGASATFLSLHAFYNMRSRRDIPNLASAIEGRDIFSKYLKTKLEIKYPETKFGPQGGTRPLEIVYGFCTPLNLTDRTTPKEDSVTEQEIMDHLVEQIGDDFDSSDDTMEFKERRRRHYNIVGRFRVKPNNNGLVPSPLSSNEVPGAVGTVLGERDVPPLRRNVQWKMMKKVRYHRSDQGDSPDPIEPIMYPNQAYLPFLLLYNPDYSNYSNNTTDAEGNAEIRQVSVRFNTCHWFNDF